MGLSIKLADVVLLQIGKKFQMCHSLCLMLTVNLSRVQMSFVGWLVLNQLPHRAAKTRLKVPRAERSGLELLLMGRELMESLAPFVPTNTLRLVDIK